MSDIPSFSDQAPHSQSLSSSVELNWNEFLTSVDSICDNLKTNMESQDAFAKWERKVAERFRSDFKVQDINLQDFRKKYSVYLGVPGTERMIDTTMQFLKESDLLWYALFRTPDNCSCAKFRANIDDVFLTGLTEYLIDADFEMLTRRNNAGNTILMQILKTLEYHKHRISLIPALILRTWTDNPFDTNNTNEDILYIAAMHCPSIPEMAGYIASLYIRDETNVNARLYTPQGISLIHALVERGDSHVNVLKELILLKDREGKPAFDVNIKMSQSRTPLYMAVVNHKTFREDGVRFSSVNIVKLLMMSRSDPTIQHSETGNTPLHLAIIVTRDVAIIKALLTDKGIDALKVENSQGLTVHDLIKGLSEGSQENAEIENIVRSLR